MKTNILISIVIALATFSCSSNQENLIPAPTVSTDSVYSYGFPLINVTLASFSNGDVVISADSVINLAFNILLKAGAEIKQVDIQFGGVPTKLSTSVFFPSNYKGSVNYKGSYNYNLKDNWVDSVGQQSNLDFYKSILANNLTWISLNENGNIFPAFSAKNSSFQPYTQIINDVEEWWPNVSFNGGFDSALASKMRIVIPKAKGEIVMNVIVHDKTGKEAYLTRKITVKK